MPVTESFSIQFVFAVKLPRTQYPYYVSDLHWLSWRSACDFGKEKWKVSLFQTDSLFILFIYDILKNKLFTHRGFPFPQWTHFIIFRMLKYPSWHPQQRAFWLNKLSSQRSGLYTHLGYFQFSWDWNHHSNDILFYLDPHWRCLLI